MDAETQAKLRAIAEREQAEAAGSEPQVGPTPDAAAALVSLRETANGDEPTPEPEPAAEKPERKLTLYKVFRVEEQTLHAVAECEAPNDTKAITQVVTDANVTAGEYVAIPHRSLRIRKIGVVNEPRIVVS